MLLPQYILFSCHRALLALNRQTILRGNFGYLSVDVTGLKFKSLLAKKTTGVNADRRSYHYPFINFETSKLDL